MTLIDPAPQIVRLPAACEGGVLWCLMESACRARTQERLMDPVSIIIAALLAGAATGLKDTAATAVRDAYSGLRSLIRERFGSDPIVTQQLDTIRSPDADAQPLADRLREVGFRDDDEIVAAAKRLLARADADGDWVRRYNVTIENSKGVVGNNTGTVHMAFGADD